MNYDNVSPFSSNEYESNGLPVIYIHPKPVSKDFYSPVTVIYKGKEYEAEGKIRGGVTAYYPKKSYTLKFPDNDLFNDSDQGYTDRKKIVLLSNFDDNSHIRNQLAFWIWNEMDNNFKINTYSSPVYLNGSYEGLYTVVEFINENFIERNTTPIDIDVEPGGNLFKGTTNEIDFGLKSDLVTGFEKKCGTPEAGENGAFTDLEEFITFINNSSETTFNSDFSDIADTQSYYDWWFFTSLLNAKDSMGKNSYHYQDISSDGKWHYIPWDFNESFGQSWNTKRTDNSFSTDSPFKNEIFNRLIMNSDFTSTFNARYKTLLEGDLTIANILAQIDTLYDSNFRIEAMRDYSKWKNTYKDFYKWDDRDDFTSVDQEIEYMKTWITAQYSLAYELYE